VAIIFNFGVAAPIYRAYEAIPYERFIPLPGNEEPDLAPAPNNPSDDNDTNNPDTKPTDPQPNEEFRETDAQPTVITPLIGTAPPVSTALSVSTIPSYHHRNRFIRDPRHATNNHTTNNQDQFARREVMVASLAPQLVAKTVNFDSNQWSYYQLNIDPGAKSPNQSPARQYYTVSATRQIPWPWIGHWGWVFVTFSPTSYLLTALSLMLIYVPATVLVLCLLEPLGSFRVVLRRDYGPLLSTVFAAWAASHLPFALIGVVFTATITAKVAILLAIFSKLAFAGFLAVALRVVTGVHYQSIFVTIATSWIALVLQSLLLVLATPFLLLWVYAYFRGDLAATAGDLQLAHRSQQNFRRSLKMAALNPHDADAQYQIGVVYQSRRQYTRANEYFQRAVEIDKREADAYYQLGRIAREQHRLPLAIQHFDAVVQLDDKHSHSEVWREIGATYLEAGMANEALAMLEKFVERRPYDAEGLYYWGETLNRLQRYDEAKEAYRRAIEAVDTTHDHRRRLLSRWKRLARRSWKKIA
jgi:Tfp pilus assembly protein PilF